MLVIARFIESRKSRLILGIAIVVIGVAGALFWHQSGTNRVAPPQPVSTVAEVNPPATAEALVFVSGAVAHPGLYRLDVNDRISDAVAAAGGVTPDADSSRLPNFAARIHDGRQVNVPSKKARAGTTTASARLDINAAAIDELQAIPGMPEGLAQAIIEHRTQWGAFTSLSELRDALGVDRATVTALGHFLRVVATPSP